jgi:hypothetical protein
MHQGVDENFILRIVLIKKQDYYSYVLVLFCVLNIS